ncbi:hypothetical protein OAC97_04015 [Flavobacteriaceae bacterium]|jgi:hypothetical protein|nr:hypothetical protein [Flavobacteriaceae bacterium]
MAAITSAVIGIGSSAVSFAQAANQKGIQKDAEKAAEDALKDARSKLNQNFYEGLDLNLTAYDQERDALAGVASAAIQAGQAGERGAGAMAGRVLQGVQQGEQDITNRQVGKMEQLEKLVAGEESRLRDAQANIDMNIATGAQEAAAEAAINSASALSGGVQGLGDASAGFLKASELYGDSGIDPITGNPKSFGDYKKVGGEMSRSDFKGIGGGTEVGKIFNKAGEGLKKMFEGVTGIFN